MIPETEFFIIDLRQVAKAMGLSGARRAAFYREYDVPKLGPHLRITAKQALN